MTSRYILTETDRYFIIHVLQEAARTYRKDADDPVLAGLAGTFATQAVEADRLAAAIEDAEIITTEIR